MIDFEFKVSASFNFLESFSKAFNVPVFDNTLVIPSKLGKGMIKFTPLEAGFKAVTHRYHLKQDFVMKRRAPDESHDMISILFYTNETPPTNVLNLPDKDRALLDSRDSAIQIASHDLDSDTRFAANSAVNFIAVGIEKSLLTSLLEVSSANSVVTTITRPGTTFFYQEHMTLDIQKLLKHLAVYNDQEKLSKMYFKLKITELLYLLFSELLKRESQVHTPINKMDVENLMMIREWILKDLSKPPQLAELAGKSGLSPTKMKQLFKQMYGDTIYNYYQKYRMEEAAFLLKHTGYAVSETGYSLGFTNLSHFSRLFKRHYGLTPKKYASVL